MYIAESVTIQIAARQLCQCQARCQVCLQMCVYISSLCMYVLPACSMQCQAANQLCSSLKSNNYIANTIIHAIIIVCIYAAMYDASIQQQSSQETLFGTTTLSCMHAYAHKELTIQVIYNGIIPNVFVHSVYEHITRG